MDFLLLEEVDSTNSYVSLHNAELADMTMVMAATQTAGRGQRGNSWESDPGKNLTFTLLHRPGDFLAKDQFSISEAVALAVHDYLAECGVESKVKWPNDIYVGDRKISGILIEHAVTGSKIEHSRIGVGLNLNQEVFRSDAPNPVSLYQITGKRFDVSRAAASLGAALERRLAQVADMAGRTEVHRDFKSSLWRGDGKPYPFAEPGKHRYPGIIRAVDPDGLMTVLNTEKGEEKRYYFKEIEFILK